MFRILILPPSGCSCFWQSCVPCVVSRNQFSILSCDVSPGIHFISYHLKGRRYAYSIQSFVSVLASSWLPHSWFCQAKQPNISRKPSYFSSPSCSALTPLSSFIKHGTTIFVFSSPRNAVQLLNNAKTLHILHFFFAKVNYVFLRDVLRP